MPDQREPLTHLASILTVIANTQVHVNGRPLTLTQVLERDDAGPVLRGIKARAGLAPAHRTVGRILKEIEILDELVKQLPSHLLPPPGDSSMPPPVTGALSEAPGSLASPDSIGGGSAADKQPARAMLQPKVTSTALVLAAGPLNKETATSKPALAFTIAHMKRRWQQLGSWHPWLLLGAFLLLTVPRVTVHLVVRALRFAGMAASTATAEVVEQVVDEVFEMPRTLLEPKQPQSTSALDGRWLFLGIGYLLRQANAN